MDPSPRQDSRSTRNPIQALDFHPLYAGSAAPLLPRGPGDVAVAGLIEPAGEFAVAEQVLFSPDGRFVAAVGSSTGFAGGLQVWVFDAATGETVWRVTTGRVPYFGHRKL